MVGRNDDNGSLGVWEFLKDHGGAFGFFGSLAALIGVVMTYYRTAVLADMKEKLDDPHHRARVIETRGGGWTTGYFAALEGLTDWADRFYGRARFGWHAFERCLMLAFLYPVLAALLAWVVANAHSPGGLPLFDDQPGAWSRLWRAGIVLASGVSFALYLANLERIIARIDSFLRFFLPNLNRAHGFLSKACALFIAVAGAFAVAFAGAVAGEAELAALYLFFFFLLPVLNAVADMLSVAATRGFLGVVRAKRPGISAILALLSFDVIAGGLCLLLLLFLLWGGLGLWASLSPGTVPLDPMAYWQAAMADYWQGTALLLMALTTLLPTIVHLVMGFAAILSHKSRLNMQALTELQAAIDRDGPSPADRTDIAKRLIWADIYGITLVLGILGAIVLGPIALW